MATTSALPLRRLLHVVLLIALTYPHYSTSECYTYLAPSTIPGAGLGVFAGSKSYQENDQVSFGDLVVPLSDYKWHNKQWKTQTFLWDHYTWSHQVFPGMGEDSIKMSVASFGMGAAPNCILALINVEDHDDKIQIDNAGLDSNSPGVGSFTPYHGRVFRASQDIPAGMELFVDYGRGYFRSRKHFGVMPLEEDYEIADDVLLEYLWFKDYYSGEKDADWDSENVDTDYQAFVPDLWSLLQDFKSIWNESTVLAAIPEEERIIEDLMNDGGTEYTSYNRSIRDIAWLEEHGECMDNIRDGTSTIPHAGRGAFANRNLPKGSLVAPVPLIHIYDKDYFVTYGMADYSLEPNQTAPVHSQLMQNYCFGHPQSQLMLCPYGMLTASINHAHEKPNIKIEWSKSRSMRHPEWKDMPLDKWANERQAGLSFQYVALRDIEEGEEILLDYGAAWDKAWKLHVRNFRTMREHYVPAFELNELIADNLQIRTTDERSYETDRVRLFCRREFAEWSGLGDIIRHLRGPNLPCRVLERRDGDGETSYVAEVIKFRIDEHVCDSTMAGILWNVTRDAFYFVDLPYGRDHHQPWTFRHEMHIPDDIFPEIWKTTTTTKP